MKLVKEHINFEKPKSEEDFRDSLFDKSDEDKIHDIYHTIYIIINGDDVVYKGEEDPSYLNDELGHDIYDLEDEEYLKELNAYQINRIYNKLKELGHI